MIILFDLDGTLIDSTEAILESFHYTFVVHAFNPPEDALIKSFIGYPLDIMFINLGVLEEMVWDFVATYKQHYRKISIQKTFLLTGAKEAIIQASEFATLGIVTTKTAEYSKILLEHFELMHYFRALIGREDVINPKPHAEPILKAIKILEDKTQDIWMIGDTKLDLISAQNAGIHSIGVLSGYDSYEMLQKHTNIIFEDVLKSVIFLKNRKK